MDIGQIRDAAIASQFPSREALSEWLGRAIGEHQKLLYRALWHARQAVMRCPLQGEAYLFLAELVFLEGQIEDADTSMNLLKASWSSNIDGLLDEEFRQSNVRSVHGCWSNGAID